MDRLEELKKLQQDDPHDPFLDYAIALELAKRDQRPGAIARLEELLAKNPDYLGAYYQLGQWYEQESRFPEAKNIYTRGIALAQQKKNQKTLGELRTALDLLDE